MEVWVPAPNVAQVAFEVLHVDCVEADDGGEQANVSLSQAVSEVEGAAGLGQICFGAVE